MYIGSAPPAAYHCAYEEAGVNQAAQNATGQWQKFCSLRRGGQTLAHAITAIVAELNELGVLTLRGGDFRDNARKELSCFSLDKVVSNFV